MTRFLRTQAGADIATEAELDEWLPEATAS
jgi:hypothetical protein